MAANDQFRQQLEALYRAEPQAKPSQPIANRPPPLYNTGPIGFKTGQAAAKFDELLKDHDASRGAAIERNNAIQDQQQRQIRANQIQQQERAAIDRINRSRLARPPLELREREDPKPRTRGITDIGSGSTPRQGGGGSTPRAGGRIPGGGPGAETIAGDLPRLNIPIPAAARAAIGRLGLGSLASASAGFLPELGLLAYDRLTPRWTRIGNLATQNFAVGDILQDQFFRNGAPSLPDLGQLPRDIARAFGLDHPRGIPDTSQTPRSPLGTVPFEGGQSPGINYVVSLTITGFDGFGNPTAPQQQDLQAIGPIGGARVTESPDGSVYLLEILSNGVWSSFSTASRRQAGGANLQAPILSISGVRRLDGQPDTGGNPAPVAGPNDRPRSPIGGGTYLIQPPSRTPTAVPLNNPRNLPIGAPEPEENKRRTPLPVLPINPLSPASTIAPTITPEQLKRVNPTDLLIPDSLPNQATNPTPHTGLSTREGTAGGRLGQEGQYGQTVGDYLRSVTPAATPGMNADTGGIPGIVPAIALGGLLLGGLAWRNINQPATTPTPTTPPDTGTDTGGNSFTCRFHEDTVSHNKLDATGRLMRAIDVAQTAAIAEVNGKLGDSIPNGGIAGKLGRMGALASKTWNFLQVDRVLNVLSWMGIIHNAYMLSSNLGQTLFSAIGTGLDVIGIQKVDEDGNESPYDIGEIVNKYTDAFGKNVFGVSQWKGIKNEWKALNRIYQAASNILFSLQSITFSMVEMLETISNYVGKIGNSLRRSGTILQNSFNWMNPNANYTNNRFFNALNNTQEAVEVIDQIASEVKSTQDTGAELYNQKTEFDKARTDAEKALQQSEDKSKANSVRPSLVINPVDERKAE